MKTLFSIVYGFSTLGMLVTVALIFHDIGKYVRELKKTGVKFKGYPLTERVFTWLKLLLCIFCPIFNTLLFIAMMFGADNAIESATRGINSRIIKEEK